MKEQFHIFAEDKNGKHYMTIVNVTNWIAIEKEDVGVTKFLPEILTRIEYIMNDNYRSDWCGRFIPSYIYKGRTP